MTAPASLDDVLVELAAIKQLLALQIRLSVALKGDGEARTQIKNDIAAVLGGDLEQVGVRQHLERLDLGDDLTEGISADRVSDTAVVDGGHDSSPSVGADTPSVGDECSRAGNPHTGAGPGSAEGPSGTTQGGAA